MRKREHSLLTDAASLLLCGLLAGLVVAAAAFPAIAMSGLAAKAGADTFDSLPTEIDTLPSPQISYVYASDGKTLLAQLFDENRHDVSLADVAKVMQDAIVAAEDNRFYQHHGVDVKGVARAFVANQRADGATEQGASTLTMQYVRQAISYSARTPQQVIDATDKTPARKLREMKLAIALEKKLTKAQILERYLNIAAFGHGAYGIYAASQVYFAKLPKDLTLPEAALLASLVKAPTDYDPATEKGLPKALDRSRNYTLKNMVTLNMITEAQRTEAVAVTPQVIGKRTPEGCLSVQRPELGAGFMCDYLVRWWLDQKELGADAYERGNRLRSGGYTIISSMDIGTQTAAFKYAKQQEPSSTFVKMGDATALMIAAVEPGTGRVKALATNRNFSNDQSQNGPNTNPARAGQKGNYPNTTVPILTGSPDVPGYQAGSVFKFFTMVAALEAGFPLATTINVTSPFHSNYPVERGSPAACPGTNDYCPKNSGNQQGNYNMWTGFGSSINTFFVPLEQMVGAEHAVDVAKRLGVKFSGDEKVPGNDAYLAAHPHTWGAFTLGVSAITPLQLVNALATLAADGMYCEPTPVLEVHDLSGKPVDVGKPKCKQVVDPQVARAAIDAARCPVGDQSAAHKCEGATARDIRGIVGRPLAGKTGTTDSERTATFTAMTKELAVTGFLADPDFPLQERMNMKHPPLNHAVAYTLRDALAGRPASQFPGPNTDKAYGKLVGIPNVQCQPPDAAKALLRSKGFTVDVSNQQVASPCPAGTVAKTEPGGATVKNGAVMIFISKGPGAAGPGTGGGGNPPPTRPPRKCPVPPFCP
jgi:membrane peptidoglycan carboxypeptidase